MLEVHLVAEHETIVRRELQLVVIGEPVEAGAFGDDACRRKFGYLLTTRGNERAEGEGGEKSAT